MAQLLAVAEREGHHCAIVELLRTYAPTAPTPYLPIRLHVPPALLRDALVPTPIFN